MPRLFPLLFFFTLLLFTAKAQEDTLAQEDVYEQADTFSQATNIAQDAYLEQTVQPHGFDQKKWKSLKEGMDYSNSGKKKERKKRSGPTITGMGPFFKYVAVFLAIALLVFLIVKMAGGENLFVPKNRKLKPSVSDIELENIEENLHEAELNDPIRRAAAAGDFPLAVRLHYLAVLKELALKKHIRWKRDKTNGEYLKELAGSPLFGPVREVTLIFERVWYGKTAVTRVDFQELETKFRQTAAAVQAQRETT
ncbi:MAG: DUF4129 domain-containing protein [Bacteroidetes bacterium]|nr:DUF4129 domain-containing protein [Bacteroidota bacterium]